MMALFVYDRSVSLIMSWLLCRLLCMIMCGWLNWAWMWEFTMYLDWAYMYVSDCVCALQWYNMENILHYVNVIGPVYDYVCAWNWMRRTVMLASTVCRSSTVVMQVRHWWTDICLAYLVLSLHLAHVCAMLRLVYVAYALCTLS